MSAPGPSRPSSLRAEGLTLDVGGVRILRDIDLSVDAGVPLALTGPSGAGKTMLCLALAGVAAPTAGSLLVDETPWGDATVAVGLVLQAHGLVTGLTAEENVALPLQDAGVDAPVIGARVHDALERVGLGAEGPRRVEELSGGERQRVGVARALALDPDILVADEPTSELDPGNRRRVLELLAHFASLPRLLVVATDDGEVLRSFSRVVALSDGAVLPAAGGGSR